MQSFQDFTDRYYVEDAQEGANPYAGMQLAEHGAYLCVQWGENPVYVYKRIEPGEAIHPCITQMEYNGQGYRLECVEDEKEHATSRRCRV